MSKQQKYQDKNHHHLKWKVFIHNKNLGGFKLFQKLLINQGYSQNIVNDKGHANLHIIDEESLSKNRNKLLEILRSFKGIKILIKGLHMSQEALLALSGNLSTFGQNSQRQFIPSYLLDIVLANSLAIMVLQIFYSQHTKNQNQIVQIPAVDLIRYFGAFNVSAKQNGIISNPLGRNYLDGGAPFYRIYKCKQGHIAVGNLQPKFYHQMIKGFKDQICKEEAQFLSQNQHDLSEWSKVQQILQKIFLKKTASQWQSIMSKFDTCMTEVKGIEQSKKSTKEAKITKLFHQPKL